MTRKLLAVLILAMSAMPALAAPPTEASIDELLTITQSEKMLETVFTNTDALMHQSLAEMTAGEKLSEKQQQIIDSATAGFLQVVRDEMSWAKMRPLYVQLYQESFTQEEIDGLVNFYKSPAGAAFVQKMPAVVQRSMVMMQSRMGPMMQKMRAVMQKAVEDAKAAQ